MTKYLLGLIFCLSGCIIESLEQKETRISNVVEKSLAQLGLKTEETNCVHVERISVFYCTSILNNSSLATSVCDDFNGIAECTITNYIGHERLTND